jgi:inner membrane transporter RhtA
MSYQPAKSSYSLALLCVLIAMMVMQSSGSLAKILFNHFSPLTVSFMRLCFGALILALMFRVWRAQFKTARWPIIVAYGAALSGMNVLFYLALARLPLGIVVTLEFIGPLSVALFHARQKIDVIWILCVVLGLWLLLPLEDTQHALDPLGVVLALGAGACWGAYILVAQRPTGISGAHTVCLGMLVGMCCVLPLLVSVSDLRLAFNWPYVLYFLGLALLASAIPFSLDMVALKRLPAMMFGMLMSLEPAMAALSGLVFLHEKLLSTQWIALLLIISASVGCSYTTQRAQKRKLAALQHSNHS